MGDVSALISRGKSNRSTYSTNMNEHSSRSHLVLSVYVTATNNASGACVRACVWLALIGSCSTGVG